MIRQLIVNADDFGRTRGVSAGILRAHLEGIVTSATAMMNMPGVAADLHLAQTEAPRLGLGVHLNFTAGRPLLPTEWCASLVDEHGYFLKQEVITATPDRLKPDELRAELKSQITTFKNAMNALPDHLDAHHFVHLYPPLFEVYLDLADSFKLPVRIPFPRQADQIDHIPPIIRGVPPETARSIVRADQQQLAARSIKAPDHFLATFYDPLTTVEHLLRLLENLAEGTTELMTHPGAVDERLQAESHYTTQREQEAAALTSPQVKARLTELGIQLITFADL
ncbi:Carbohydrate deacetylase [Thermoflexales bacterium]|nr:Carbohydrate deacetylase [Thermoflexales bacterium]